MNVLAFSLFLAIVALTLVITYFASRRTKTSSDFYTADGSLTGCTKWLGHRWRLYVSCLIPRYSRLIAL